MLVRLANLITWIFYGSAALLLALLAVAVVLGDPVGHWPALVFFALLAGCAFGLGKAVRYVIVGQHARISL